MELGEIHLNEQNASQQSINNNQLRSWTSKYLIWLLFAMSILTFLFVVPAALTDSPKIGHWFEINDLVRIIDPVVTLPLNYYIFIATTKSKHYNFLDITLFMVGAAIYVQGHAVHLTSTLLKRPLDDFIKDNEDIEREHPILTDIYENSRSLWEHTIGHYMYAVGAVIISSAQIVVHRDEIHEESLTKIQTLLFFAGSFVYGALITGVMIDFPEGTIVGTVFLLVYAVPLAIYVFLKNGKRIFPLKPIRIVLQFYSFAYTVSLILLIIWLIVAGGFKDKLQAGF